MRTTTASATIVLLFCFALLMNSAASAEITGDGEREITHLLDYLGSSGCQFFRNGKWYSDMKTVRGHAEQKLRYFADKGRIHSAEDFIDLAAARSELSGKPYLVKCGKGPVETSAQWLKEELDRYRKGESTPATRQQPKK